MVQMRVVVVVLIMELIIGGLKLQQMKIKSNYFQKEFDVQKAELIGEGNFAQVYRAYDNQLKDSIAIRRVKKDGADSEDINKQKVINEQLRKVQNENILKIYDIIDLQDTVWYITQYCSGGSLWDALNLCQDNRMSEKEALEIVLQISKGVQELHNHRITHRDLKPQNILLKSKYISGKNLPTVKLADFGLSTQKIIMETIAGTKEYIAPEQAKFHNYTNAVDVWSLGIIFDEILHGSPFYSGTDNKQVFNKILKIPYKVRDEGIRQSIKDLLVSLLKKKPYERPIIAVIRSTVEKILAEIEIEQPSKQIISVNDRMKKIKASGIQIIKSSSSIGIKEQNEVSIVIPSRERIQHKNAQKSVDSKNQLSFNQFKHAEYRYNVKSTQSRHIQSRYLDSTDNYITKSTVQLLPSSQRQREIQPKYQSNKSCALIQPPNFSSRPKMGPIFQQEVLNLLGGSTPKSQIRQKKQRIISLNEVKKQPLVSRLRHIESIHEQPNNIIIAPPIQVTINQNNLNSQISTNSSNSQLNQSIQSNQSCPPSLTNQPSQQADNKSPNGPTYINNKLLIYKNQKKKAIVPQKKDQYKNQIIDIQTYRLNLFNSKKNIQENQLKVQKKFNSFLPNIHLNANQFKNIDINTDEVLLNFSKKYNFLNYFNPSEDYEIRLLKGGAKIFSDKQSSTEDLSKIQQNVKRVFFDQLDNYIDQYIDKVLK